MSLHAKPSRNAKRIPVRVLNPMPGGAPYTSLAHARRYVNRGVARFTESGALEFLHRRAAENGPQMDVAPFQESVSDSGVSGFLRYPMPRSGSTLAARYAPLARKGAGL